MYVVFLSGGIASGKSTVARELVSRGVCLVDLDALSREVTACGSPTNELIAQAFGADVLSDNGELKRGLLAELAFASAQSTQLLEQIVHPGIRNRLNAWMEEQEDDSLCVVEIPLLDRVEDLLPLANEVLCVVCPLSLRRVRAQGRGMNPNDFDARVQQQPTDDYLVAHATTVFDNGGSIEDLSRQIDEWWRLRSESHVEFRNCGRM